MSNSNEGSVKRRLDKVRASVDRELAAEVGAESMGTIFLALHPTRAGRRHPADEVRSAVIDAVAAPDPR
jgi:hypothetical protein